MNLSRVSGSQKPQTMLLFSTCVGALVLLGLASGVSTLDWNAADVASASKTKALPKTIKEGFSLDEIIDKKFVPESWQGVWVSDSEYVYQDPAGSLVIFSVKIDRSQVIVPSDVMENSGVQKPVLSSDLKYVLLATGALSLQRKSSTNFNVIYDISSRASLDFKKKLAIQSFGHEGNSHSSPEFLASHPEKASTTPQLECPVWSPKGSSLVFVFNNNVFYRASPTSEDVQLSTSGLPDTILNSVCPNDHVLMREPVKFSPDGKQIAWIEMNYTEVDRMPLELYGEPGSLESQYPSISELHYSKPGRKIPGVNVFIARVDTLSHTPEPMLLQPPIYFNSKVNQSLVV